MHIFPPAKKLVTASEIVKETEKKMEEFKVNSKMFMIWFK